MNGFELHMDERSLYQKRQTMFIIVQETLETIQSFQHLGRRWRNKGRIARTTAGNPVLRTPKLPSILVFTACTL